MSKAVKIILGAVVVAVIAAGSFYGGMVYGEQQTPAAAVPMDFPEGFQLPDGAVFSSGAAGGPGPRGQGGEVNGFGAQPGMIFGEIQSIDGDTLVIAVPNGQQTRVQITDTTLIEKNASVEITDLAAGETVMVSGSENSDGSVMARSVQVAPTGRMMVGPGQ